MLKILHIITELELGGAQKLTLNILKYLDNENFRKFLFSSPKGLLVKEVQELKDVKIKLSRFLIRTINPFYDLIALIHIFIFIKKNKIDIVHTNSSKAGITGRWAAKLAGVKFIIHTYHGFGFNPLQNILTRNFFIFLEKATSYISDVLIYVSKSNFKKATKLGIGNNKKNVLIFTGIDKKLFLNSNINLFEKKKQLGIKKEMKVVAMISPLKPQKAPLEYVEIAGKILQEVENVRFLLVGEGYLRNKIEKRVEELNLKEKFYLLGWRKDVYEIFPIVNVLVLTSYWEGLPHVLLESMICKKPVVAFASDGTCDIIKNNKNGYLVEPGNKNMFVQKVINILQNDKLQKKLGFNGYEFVKDKFDVGTVVKKLEILYNEFNIKK